MHWTLDLANWIRNAPALLPLVHRRAARVRPESTKVWPRLGFAHVASGGYQCDVAVLRLVRWNKRRSQQLQCLAAFSTSWCCPIASLDREWENLLLSYTLYVL